MEGIYKEKLSVRFGYLVVTKKDYCIQLEKSLKSNILPINSTPHPQETHSSDEPIYHKKITPAFLKSIGFSSATRWWDKTYNQFRVSYKIKGKDCEILVSPLPETLLNKTPEDQVNDYSDFEYLENNYFDMWNVFLNSEEDLIYSHSYQGELIEFLKICGCQLK